MSLVKKSLSTLPVSILFSISTVACMTASSSSPRSTSGRRNVNVRVKIKLTRGEKVSGGIRIRRNVRKERRIILIEMKGVDVIATKNKQRKWERRRKVIKKGNTKLKGTPGRDQSWGVCLTFGPLRLMMN